jgi:PTH1 family peptidyl-tRNA hydrolase
LDPIKLIVGLGNPGDEHARDRHNAGFWFVDALARQAGGSFSPEARFHGDACKLTLAGRDVRLLKPDTFMNRSGQSVQAMATFYKLDIENILVVHDELDLPPGTARLKCGGGHGGHNGLRDIMAHMGKDFYRLRLGIGHPGDKNKVTGYVLKAPPSDEKELIEIAIREAIDVVPEILAGEHDKVMQQLHTQGE